VNQQPTLTRAIAEQISHDIARLQELSSSAIATPTRDQEINALQGQLASALLQFAPDLISAWFIVKAEYEPFMGALATVFSRINQINTTRHMIAAKQQAAQQQGEIVKVFSPNSEQK
jgi:hypothetical protein